MKLLTNQDVSDKRRPPGSKTARETQLPGLDEATAASQQRVPRSVEIDESARLAPRTMSSETRSRVDRGQTQPQAPRGQTHPQDASLSLGRICSTPSQTHLPAEGPLFQPSLALNIDPAPVQPLTRPTLPQPPARAPIQSCSSYRPLQLTRITPSSHRHPHDSPTTPAPDSAPDSPCTSSSQTNTLHFLQSGSPLPCTSSSPANPSPVSSTGPGMSSATPQAKGPSPVTRPVQGLLICSSSRQRPRVCS